MNKKVKIAKNILDKIVFIIGISIINITILILQFLLIKIQK